MPELMQVDIANPRDMADVMTRFINVCSDRQLEVFVECFSLEHRTLQQKFSSLVVHWIKNCVKQGLKGHVDARNKASTDVWTDIAAELDRVIPGGLALFRRFPIV